MNQWWMVIAGEKINPEIEKIQAQSKINAILCCSTFFKAR